MDLDFSKIDTLGSSQNSLEAPKQVSATNTPTTSKKPSEAKSEPKMTGLQKEADSRKKLLEDSADILQEYQKNKRLTTLLVSDITKGLQEGLDIYDLFLKSVEALSLATNDEGLYIRSREAVKSIYGIGLDEDRPLELEIGDTHHRLERLKEALSNADNISDKERLKRAVEAHSKRLKALKDRTTP